MARTQKPLTLGEFIQQEMDARHMSARKFAELLGVSHTLVNQYRNYGAADTYGGKPMGKPSRKFLEALAEKTNTDFATLLALVAPETDDDLSPAARLLAQRIMRLPDDDRRFIESHILRLLADRNQSVEDT